jgi:hypothetical protein
VGDRPKYAPKVKGRLVRAMIPTFIAYLAIGGVGLYFLATDRILPAIGCILAANVMGFGFHRWAERLPREEGGS